MKITKLHAQDVHGHLLISVDFFDDLTFLTGLNGSGKTTALRLLMGLMTPSLNELGLIRFSSAEVTIRENDSSIKITAKKTDEGLELAISTIDEKLYIGRAELDFYKDSKRPDEPRLQIKETYQKNKVLNAISQMATPMFLGLDRRFSVPGVANEDSDDFRRREYLGRRYWPDDPSFRGQVTPASLMEINYLVVTRMQEIQAEQERLDERLRSEFIKKAFEYKPGSLVGDLPVAVPSRSEQNQYRKQLAKIAAAAEGVKIPMPEIESALSAFFERMSVVIDSLEKSDRERKAKKDSKKTSHSLSTPDKAFIDWIINRPQVDRILEHLQLLNEYIENRNSLRNPINKFRLLVNDFLAQTGKKLDVAANGQLTVQIGSETAHHSINTLSSGERQLLIMLAHLSLSPNLAGSGVFIVDEPELSLHIDWQEKFVDSIREANPNVQLILATHSPAIILDHDDACRTLTESHNA